MTTPCFWVERTGEAEVSLRRYSEADTPCPAGARSYHNAVVPIGRVPLDERPDGTYSGNDDSVPHDDPRWPTACACGYAFAETDAWQVNHDAVYGADGREWPARSLPPGAMLDARWSPAAWKGPDGLGLTVVLPEGPYVEGETDTRGWWWNVDGPSNDGAGNLNAHAWTRTGDPKAVPPTISATPSINAVGRYHGFLTNGVLTDNIG